MKYEKITKAAEIISQRVLTPIIYMSEHDDWVEFICFCDSKITIQELYDTEQILKEMLDKDAELVDIREFTEFERLDIINQYELIYSENPFVEKMFTVSMLTDYRNITDEKRSMLDRQHECGTYFLQ